MKKTLLLLFAIIFTITISAQVKSPHSKYNVVVSFGSICCGTASDDFLKAHIKKFIKLHKVTLPSYKASGCGREGEYRVMFVTTKLKPALKKKFINDLKNVVLKEDKKNKIKDSSSGSINVEFNITTEDVSYCRGGIQKW